jgi:hypothetical protein
LPQSKAQALGKKGRASAAAKKRREDPNPERRGPAKNVATKVKEQDVAEDNWDTGDDVRYEEDDITGTYYYKGWKFIETANDAYSGEAWLVEPDGDETWYGYEVDENHGIRKYYDKQGRHAFNLSAHDEGQSAEKWLKAHASDWGTTTLSQPKPYTMNEQGIAEDDLDEACWKGYHKEGMKTMFGKRYPNCVKNKNESLEVYVNRGECPGCGGAMVAEDQIDEKQDACYHKVKSRYKVWPSAYASGALVQCRKKGAANWGNKSKNESVENMMDELNRILELSTGMSTAERAELAEEFDLIESNIDMLAERNGVDAEAIWEDLETLTDDELYVFAVTQPVMEDWQKANKKDRTAGMSQKAVNAYRRENPGSKLKTAVTTKPSKLKKGSKASKRRKSYCSRSRGQMKMHNISCAKTPDKAICAARRRWNCE